MSFYAVAKNEDNEKNDNGKDKMNVISQCKKCRTYNFKCSLTITL